MSVSTSKLARSCLSAGFHHNLIRYSNCLDYPNLAGCVDGTKIDCSRMSQTTHCQPSSVSLGEQGTTYRRDLLQASSLNLMSHAFAWTTQSLLNSLSHWFLLRDWCFLDCTIVAVFLVLLEPLAESHEWTLAHICSSILRFLLLTVSSTSAALHASIFQPTWVT